MSSAVPLLAVRADGGPGRGVGHLARTLALVQAWRDRHGEAVLVTREAPAFWVQQFRHEGCIVVDPQEGRVDADWWAIDGYHLGEAGERHGARRILRIDDRDETGTRGRGSDILVDQNLGVDPGIYSEASAVLVGPRYALLRRSLRAAAIDVPVPSRAKRLVIVLGGAPTDDVRQVGEAVAADPRLAGVDVSFLGGEDDVPAALDRADLALAAAGTVSWELCCRGVPAVLIAVAPNQEGVASELALAGAALHVPVQREQIMRALADLVADAKARTRMRERGRMLVDGLGARRVVCRLRGRLIQLREATASDAALLYEWGNDSETRAASFATEPISWEEHAAWLDGRLGDPRAVSYVGSDGAGELGFVRFDLRPEGQVEIGITIAPDRRRQGWGGALIDAGCQRWLEQRGPSRIHARIKKDNAGSIRSFEDADFDLAPTDDPDVLTYARTLHGTAGRV